MLSDLIRELQAALDANGNMSVDIVVPGSARRVLRPSAVFVWTYQPAKRLQITVQ